MIFLTVGGQLPFDRLVHAVDEWATLHPDVECSAQVGVTSRPPSTIPFSAFLEPAELRRRIFEADLVVTHAGMGTILTALELGTPLVVMPRHGARRETRNDHQLATARVFADHPSVSVAWDESELPRLLATRPGPVERPIPSHASLPLLTALRGFITGEDVGDRTPASDPAVAEETPVPRLRSAA
ncbi:MAG: glycosyl transferase family 28 [Phycisphaerales bacterium]|nr:glycosyl transferase family 28 [Phycisphaerae bacterium]NNF42461.1 glycosyl transferase family 28 [Phycisphaerales bacterium]NNM27385.1 glycosyl transferase family 28 [Phycisphaerales bacterium]